MSNYHHSGLPSHTMIKALSASGFTLTSDHFFKLKQVAYKLAKKYRLLANYDDILQIVLLTSCTKEKDFDPDKSKFTTFVYVIAERRVINSYIRFLSTATLGKKVQVYVKKIKKQTGEAPSITDVAQHFKVSEETIRATYLYRSAENDFRLLQDTFSAMQEDNPLDYWVEMDEMFTKGFERLTDLQRAVIDELIIKESSIEVAAAKLGISIKKVDVEYQKALEVLRTYV